MGTGCVKIYKKVTFWLISQPKISHKTSWVNVYSIEQEYNDIKDKLLRHSTYTQWHLQAWLESNTICPWRKYCKLIRMCLMWGILPLAKAKHGQVSGPDNYQHCYLVTLVWFGLVKLRVRAFASSRKYSLALLPPLCTTVHTSGVR